MSDLIDRQVAIDAMMAEVDDKDRPNVELRWWNMGLTRASKILEQLPTAEPKTGRWIPRDWNETNCKCRTLLYCLPKCSVCGYSADYTNYCPNCGARMKGEADEH